MNVKDYMKLPYTRLVQEVNEELYEGLNEAMEGYIEVKLENGLKIPVPEKTEKYSGRI